MEKEKYGGGGTFVPHDRCCYQSAPTQLFLRLPDTIDTLLCPLQCTSQGSCLEVIATAYIQETLSYVPASCGHFGLMYCARLVAVTLHGGVVVGATPRQRAEAEQHQIERMVEESVVRPCSECELKHTRRRRGRRRSN